MKFSQLFTKTLREAPTDETAINAQLLIRGGFVFKNSAGIYSYLPLGWRVLSKIANVIREEINAIGGQELFMSALVEKKYMEPTGRWNLDVGYFAKGLGEEEASFVMGWSHEEVLTAISARYISSYKDLPFSAYQIQTKFRHEARAKSGLLRGREFMMKDLYSFHASQESLNEYYEKAKNAYLKIFNRCGLKAVYTLAAGGIFTDKFTHEFQVVADVGEDTIYVNEDKNEAINKEVFDERGLKHLGWKKEDLVEKKSIEVGNIFDQGTKYSEALGLYFTDEGGDKKPVIMGAYGIGLGRIMATVVEVSSDDKGIIWPENIAPFRVHLITLNEQNSELRITNYANKIYEDLIKNNVEVLYDDREDKAPGEKFADADLIGCPIRLVVSKKTLEKDSVELKHRNKKELELVALSDIKNRL
ncbi:MAG: prolyl-tRNA synthetase [Candidatus Yanofskybacteria bacterium]|nr:prolyl-tRNA synthetase [Candidatus Yanofskybacteria bacterium]